MSLPKHPLETFFAPDSIAVIGASRDEKKIPGLLLTFLRRNGFTGAIYPVNPAHDSIGDLPCYRSVGAIGRPVDLAVVIIPAHAVLAALEDCAAAGVRHAIIISSGFAEEGGASADTQAEIAALARRTGMRVCGPNAEGFYNEPQRVAATFSPTVDVKPDAPRLVATPRRLGIVAQSGGIGFAIYNRARAMGIAVSKVISTGNEADLATGEFLDYLAQDDATDVVVLFVEGIRDPQAFVAAARRAAGARKPVIAVKVGRSGAGERAAASHTASMAGWAAAYDAVFARYGIIGCDDLDEAVAIAAAFCVAPAARGRRVGVVTVSGGAGAWIADAIAANGLQIPELSPPLQAEIRALIPSYGSPRNPVDITAQAVHSGGLQKVVELLEASDEVDAIAVVVSLASETRMPVKAAEIGPLIGAQRKPILIFSYTLPSAFARTELAAAGTVAFTGVASLARALRCLADRGSFALPAPMPARPRVQIGIAGRLSEHESKTLLREAGIAVPHEVLVPEKVRLAAALAETSFPLVMKIQSRDIPHKSEAGGVRLDIRDAGEAATAFTALIERARRFHPDADIQGVLIGPTARSGVEMIVGAVNDPTFGPIMMVGFGGVATELFRDVVYRPAPVDETEALVMIGALKSAPLLDGFRGAPKADKAALAALIARLSSLAEAWQDDVAEIEINPVRVHAVGEGVTVVDALVVGRRAAAPPRPD
jgi:acyl-CoA synthetase (NDP forming)